METSLYKQFKDYDSMTIKKQLRNADKWIKNIFKLAWGKNGIEYNKLYPREELLLEKAIIVFGASLQTNQITKKDEETVELSKQEKEQEENKLIKSNNISDTEIDLNADYAAKTAFLKKEIKKEVVHQQLENDTTSIKKAHQIGRRMKKSEIIINNQSVESLDEYFKVSNDIIDELIERVPILERQCIKFYFGIGVRKFEINEIGNILNLSEKEVISTIKSGIFTMSNLMRIMKSKNMIYSGNTNNASYVKK